MAELTVKAQYKSKIRDTSLFFLRLGFPLWGLVIPIGGAVCLIAFIVTLIVYSRGNFLADVTTNATFLASISSVGVGCLAISLAALSLTRLLSLDCIVADKNGLQFPLMALGNLRRYRSWSSIRKIDAIGSTANWKSKAIVFYGDHGRPLKLPLERLSEAETEQLLLAMDMWAPNTEKTEAIKEIREQLQNEAPKRSDMSFTDMWEAELSHRFCATSFMPLEPGTIIRKGSIKIVRQLAMGGLSAIYLGQLDGKELVVIKEAVVPDESPDNIKEKARELFERESRLLMRLKHANIVKVLDHFVDQERNYMMLEYINGQDLRQFVKQNGAQPERIVIEWAIQIANVLKYLHEQDPAIIHRDLTPDNLVLREDGSLVLIDFGAANEFISNATGTFVGKQAYIAPEQFRGKPVTQSDIYALGCTLHFVLTGQDPEALSESAPRELQANVSVDMNEFVVSCTQPEPRDRYQSAAQVLPVLKKMAASLLVS